MSATVLLVGMAAIPALADNQFTTTANPISIGPPVQVPHLKPIVVPIVQNHGFHSPTAATSTITLPKGHWSEVVLTVTGSQRGRQYDRLCQIWAGNTQIFNGVTPEPTAQGITWTATKDVTQYLPVLSGTEQFTTQVDNYVSSVDDGVPDISATLSFYPAKGKAADPNSGALPTPTSIVPLATQAGSDTLNAGKTWSTNVTLPNNVAGAYLDLYATAQINEEFWWDNQPAFREIEISIDGKPAGIVWPFPYIYTGGVNPLLWRPITAIHTLDMPSYKIDLSPFAGMLHGTHTISITVLNNSGYWLMNGSLMLYQVPRAKTSGAITTDTLKFPTAFANDTQGALHSSSGVTLQNDTAENQYKIQGTIDGVGHKSLSATVSGNMTFSNDQTNTKQDYWGLVHGAQYVSTDESLMGPGVDWQRQSQVAYTVDSGSSYYQAGSGFYLPANVTQSLNVEKQQSGLGKPYSSTLYENIQGYGALQEASKNISQGATTGTTFFHNSSGYHYHAFVMARGGSFVVHQISSSTPQKSSK